ncbi:alkaline phosphatase family protein [Fusibacter sp. 3D3]|uniref:alkaline phosphatase family protein n=1 Tax=Fusibacter sp. 3D3 TaxID=1048380 RepID=UPI000852CEF0|nr:alkaline phosphatase family protein [Fusibacter sp. 3D3]GAU79567.1 hypothetical protein F3D3_4231 [Fusibacter sp. 3D3]
MCQKVIFVILDGLNYKTARSQMGYMAHLTEQNVATLYRVKSQLPAMSRPLYESLLTGTTPCVHGVLNNQTTRRSQQVSVFDLAVTAGLKTGAAAYHWMCELYNESPFNPFENRIMNDETKSIQHGMFYYEDDYPDTHLLADSMYILKQYKPDFIVIHPMNIDLAGHEQGCDSKAYKGAAIKVDILLSHAVPIWLEQGYQVVITADHGMNAEGFHNGDEEDGRLVPLWLIGSIFKGACSDELYDQLAIAPMLCEILGLMPAESMTCRMMSSLIK